VCRYDDIPLIVALEIILDDSSRLDVVEIAFVA